MSGRQIRVGAAFPSRAVGGGRLRRRSPIPTSTRTIGSSGRAITASAGCNDPPAAPDPTPGLDSTSRPPIWRRPSGGSKPSGAGRTRSDSVGWRQPVVRHGAGSDRRRLGMWTARPAVAALADDDADPPHRTAHSLSRSPAKDLHSGATDLRQMRMVLKDSPSEVEPRTRLAPLASRATACRRGPRTGRAWTQD